MPPSLHVFLPSSAVPVPGRRGARPLLPPLAPDPAGAAQASAGPQQAAVPAVRAVPSSSTVQHRGTVPDHGSQPPSAGREGAL